MKNLIYKFSIGILTFAFGLAAVWFSLIESRQETEKVPQFLVTEKQTQLTKEEKKEINIENLPVNPYELEKTINESEHYFPTDKLWEKFGIEAKMSVLDNPFFTA